MASLGEFGTAGRTILIFAVVVCGFGGLGALATGRALARSWKPFTQAIVFMFPLAAVADFLCFALFQVSPLPLLAITRDLAKGDVAGSLSSLGGYAASLFVLGLFAFLGWRSTRARQMREQYPFLATDV